MPPPSSQPAPWEPVELTLPDGYLARGRVYAPASGQPVRSAVVCLHGIQSHAGWYQPMSEALQADGRLVLWIDRRGSGENHEQRAHSRNPEQLVQDVHAAMRLAVSRVPTRCPVDLLGISWGAKLAAVAAAQALRAPAPHRPRPRSVTFCMPGFRPKIHPTLPARLRIAASLLLGGSALHPIPLSDPALFTPHPHGQQILRDDPLALHQATASLLLTSRRLDGLIGDALRDLAPLPAAVLLARTDAIIDNAATEVLLAERLASARIIHVATDAHTPDLDPDSAAAFHQSLTDWFSELDARPQTLLE